MDAFEKGIRDQFIQKYRVREAHLPVVRGRINIQRQLRTTLTRPHIIECDVDQLDTENPYNSLIKWAASVLSRSVQSPAVKRRLADIFKSLPGPVSRSLALRERNVSAPYQYRSWSDLLELCSLLAAGYVHSSRTGVHGGYSFVFNMERLFEHFIEGSLRRIAKHFLGQGFSSKAQASTQYATSIDGKHRGFFSRPDNVIFEDEAPYCVVDAKYKRSSDGIGAKTRKPQSQDVYEIIAAMTAHGCGFGLLVYPKVISDDYLCDGQLRRWRVDSFGSTLTVGAIGVDLVLLQAKEGLTMIDEFLAAQIRALATNVGVVNVQPE